MTYPWTNGWKIIYLYLCGWVCYRHRVNQLHSVSLKRSALHGRIFQRGGGSCALTYLLEAVSLNTYQKEVCLIFTDVILGAQQWSVPESGLPNVRTCPTTFCMKSFSSSFVTTYNLLKAFTFKCFLFFSCLLDCSVL